MKLLVAFISSLISVNCFSQYNCESFENWVMQSNAGFFVDDITCETEDGAVNMILVLKDIVNIEKAWNNLRDHHYKENGRRIEEDIFDRASYIGFPIYDHTDFYIVFLYLFFYSC